MRTKEEIDAIHEDISMHVYYCQHVKGALEDGVEPLSWDEWSNKAKSFTVEAHARPVRVTQEDLQQFSNQLTAMYEAPEKGDQ